METFWKTLEFSCLNLDEKTNFTLISVKCENYCQKLYTAAFFFLKKWKTLLVVSQLYSNDFQKKKKTVQLSIVKYERNNSKLLNNTGVVWQKPIS